MSDALRGYLLSIVAVSLLTVLVQSALQAGRIRRAASVMCGVLLLLVTLSPLLKFDPEALSQSLWRVKMETEALHTGVAVKNRALVSQIIKEKTQTYILDKAEQLGFSVAVEAEMKDSGDYPYPCAVTITGTCSAEQRLALTRDIAENLAIPAERQVWKEP